MYSQGGELLLYRWWGWRILRPFLSPLAGWKYSNGHVQMEAGIGLTRGRIQERVLSDET